MQNSLTALPTKASKPTLSACDDFWILNYAIFVPACRSLQVRMTMPHIGAVFAAIAGVIAIILHSSIHKIEEGHLAVYYRYRPF